MATSTPKLFYRGVASTFSTQLYYVPSNTQAVLTDIIISNFDANQQTVTITIDGIQLVPAVPVAANGVVNLQFRTALNAASTINAFATSTNIALHLSGVTIA
jgi:hypothetical protein